MTSRSKPAQHDADALHMAVVNGDSEAIHHLLEAGVCPDVPDLRGFSPLHFAAQEYQIEAARNLLEKGAVVDSRNIFGNTPLFVAVFNSRGRGEMIRLLREAGANPQSENLSKQTPYGLASTTAVEVDPGLG